MIINPKLPRKTSIFIIFISDNSYIININLYDDITTLKLTFTFSINTITDLNTIIIDMLTTKYMPRVNNIYVMVRSTNSHNIAFTKNSSKISWQYCIYISMSFPTLTQEPLIWT